MTIRASILLFIRKLVVRADALDGKDDELQALLNFIGTVQEVVHYSIPCALDPT